MMTNIEKFLQLVKDNPGLPVIPVVDEKIVADDCCTWWMGRWGRSEVTGYYIGRNHIHFRDDDEEEVLGDMVGCKYYCAPDGRDIGELSEEEWNVLYQSIPWTKVIVVYITT